MNEYSVILVEDDVLIRYLTKKKLSDNNCNVIAETGYAEESIDIVKNNEADFVCMDINLLGEMTGLDAAKEISILSSIPIIFISAYDFENKVKELNLNNKTLFIEKPVTDHDIKKIITIVNTKKEKSNMLRN